MLKAPELLSSPGRWAPLPNLHSVCETPPPHLHPAASSAGKQEATHIGGGRKGLSASGLWSGQQIAHLLGPGEGDVGWDPQKGEGA